MKQKQILMVVLRLGCGLIDLLLIQLPVQLLMMGVMGLNASQVDLLFRLLFAVYGTLMIEYNHGATVGKSVGRLIVVDVSGAKASILYVGLRELVRSMYLIPVVGWAAGVVSLVFLLTTGRPLHDLVGNTKVVTVREYEALQGENVE